MSSKKTKTNETEEESVDATAETESSWDTDPSGTGSDAEVAANKHEKKESIEQDVDRLYDSDSNEYVLSRSKGGFSLTLDPLLIQACICLSLLQCRCQIEFSCTFQLFAVWCVGLFLHTSLILLMLDLSLQHFCPLHGPHCGAVCRT